MNGYSIHPRFPLRKLGTFYCGALSSTAARRNRGAAIETATGALWRRSSIVVPAVEKGAPQLERFYTVPLNI